MESLINNVVIFFIFVPFFVMAQTDNPLLLRRCSYNVAENINKRISLRVLPEHVYPWGVCLKTSDIPDIEKEWTRLAMHRWNTGYANYQYNRWGTKGYVNGVPDDPLFVDSCNGSKHNLIFQGRYNLPDWIEGQYNTIDRDKDQFFGMVIMDTYLPDGSVRVWDREHFINVMIHELGHALGVPHLRPEETQIMTSHGFGEGCKYSYETEICDLEPADFEQFLKPYGPESAYAILSRGGSVGGGGWIDSFGRVVFPP